MCAGPGRRLGQGDKPGDATVLPVPIGDREISGSLLATAERAHHPVGVERGKTPGRRQPWETPTLGKQSHMSTEKDADKCSSSGGNFFPLAVLFQVEGCQPFYSVLGS